MNGIDARRNAPPVETYRAGAPEAAGAGADAQERARPRILVVDDVFDNRDILTRRLVRRGFDVREAAGGFEALDALAGQAFDLVLLDIMMPDMCGNEVLRTIRRTHTALELPVIMVTAKSHSEDVVQSLELGANDYVTKPVDFAVALARINTQLRKKQAADAAAISMHAAEQKAERSAQALALESTQRRATEDRLHFLAFHDGLTGLLNRTAFREIMGETLNDPEKLGRDPALLFIDLDGFKSINDTYGHEVGDRLLAEVASRLGEIAGPGAPVARLGGDEFGILILSPGSAEAAADIAQRVVAAIGTPFVFEGQQFQIGGSCGLAMAVECGGSLNTLVKAADIAMYRAKGAGRGRFVRYDPSMLAELRTRSALEVELRHAIQNGALEIAYQPLVNAKTRQVTAFEALVRWEHSRLGLLLPEKFIPIAEETGLIVPLGALVLQRACTEAMRWPSHVRVAVNLSPLQFRSQDLLPTIERVLAETRLDPRRLELEITESALLEARERNLEILRHIRRLGIRVSMDDFGTGYSSISYLQNFDFDKIKIDRRFIGGLRSGQHGAAIVKAITDLGAGVGMELTAEGIETDEELDVLSSYGCTELQGFIFSRPLTPEAARAYIVAAAERDIVAAAERDGRPGAAS